MRALMKSAAANWRTSLDKTRRRRPRSRPRAGPGRAGPGGHRPRATRSAATTPRSCAPRGSTSSPSRTRAAHRGNAGRPPGRGPRRDAAHRRRRSRAHHLGAGRRQPDRHAARTRSSPACSASRRRRHARQRLHEGRHRRGRRAPASPAETMQFHGTADRYALDGADGGRDALLERHHRDVGPGGHAAQRRHRRRAGRGVHLRPGALGRLHAPGQPGLGRPEARRPTNADPLRRPLLRRASDWLDCRQGARSRRPTSSSGCWRT